MKSASNMGQKEYVLIFQLLDDQLFRDSVLGLDTLFYFFNLNLILFRDSEVGLDTLFYLFEW